MDPFVRFALFEEDISRRPLLDWERVAEGLRVGRLKLSE